MGKYTPKIAKKDLKHGSYYVGKCQYGVIARWNEISGCFRMFRNSLGQKQLVNIKHPEDEDKFDVFVVEAECEAQEYIPLGSVIHNKFLRAITQIQWTRLRHAIEKRLLVDAERSPDIVDRRKGDSVSWPIGDRRKYKERRDRHHQD